MISLSKLTVRYISFFFWQNYEILSYLENVCQIIAEEHVWIHVYSKAIFDGDSSDCRLFNDFYNNTLKGEENQFKNKLKSILESIFIPESLKFKILIELNEQFKKFAEYLFINVTMSAKYCKLNSKCKHHEDLDEVCQKICYLINSDYENFSFFFMKE